MFSLNDWKAIHEVFRPLPAWQLRQAWLPNPTTDLNAGIFKAGSWSDALVVYAELHDHDIFNPVHEFNETAFTQGDAFEMFMRPEGQDAYFEFHVTPHNQKLQLRFPSAEWFKSLRKASGKDTLRPCKVYRLLFESRTLILASQGKWHVLAMIPFSSVVENQNGGSPSRWLFSASRYDHTRGQKKPVLSSTSAHTHCNFHRQEEWGTLLFPHAQLMPSVLAHAEAR